jgi:hypothetical protein
MTALVINHGNIKCINIITRDIRPIIKFRVRKPQDCSRQEVKWTGAFHYQYSTPCALDLDCKHNLPHALLWENDRCCLPEGNEGILKALRRIQSGGDRNALLCCLWLIESNGI